MMKALQMEFPIVIPKIKSQTISSENNKAITAITNTPISAQSVILSLQVKEETKLKS